MSFRAHIFSLLSIKYVGSYPDPQYLSVNPQTFITNTCRYYLAYLSLTVQYNIVASVVEPKKFLLPPALVTRSRNSELRHRPRIVL
jgi:hypothetical protein